MGLNSPHLNLKGVDQKRKEAEEKSNAYSIYIHPSISLTTSTTRKPAAKHRCSFKPHPGCAMIVSCMRSYQTSMQYARGLRAPTSIDDGGGWVRVYSSRVMKRTGNARKHAERRRQPGAQPLLRRAKNPRPDSLYILAGVVHPKKKDSERKRLFGSREPNSLHTCILANSTDELLYCFCSRAPHTAPRLNGNIMTAAIPREPEEIRP